MPPHILLIVLFGATYGTLFHILQGQTLQDLLLYLITGIIGAVLGQLLGYWFGLELFSIGLFRLTEVTVVSWGCLFLIKWLKITKIEKNE